MISLTSHLSPLTTLRAIEPEDLDLLYRIENDTALWNIGTSNVLYSRYLLHDYVAHATAASIPTVRRALWPTIKKGRLLVLPTL